MRIVFMGTPEFAVPCLERIIKDKQEVVGVFTQPDKPVGRHQTLTPPPVKALAQSLGIPVFQPVKLRDGTALALLQELAPDLVVVVAYGRILPKELLDCPRLGCVNIHGSLLPKYRGAAPIQWTVLRGEETAGVTSMFMAQGLDTGDMILTLKTPVGENETAGELYERLAPIGAECLSQTLRLFEEGTVPRTPQNDQEATLAPMLEKTMGELDFAQEAQALHNQVRGLNPWPSAWVEIGGKRLKIHETRVLQEAGEPGRLVESKGLVVACGQGALELVTVQPEGKGRMSGGDYRRGARLKTGDILIG